MKGNRQFGLFFFCLFLILPVGVFAYSDQTTHPALTDEIVDLFNLYYPGLKLSDADKELIKQGSIDEDTETRPMHHFYDPVYQRGLWGNAPAKDWAVNTSAQAVLDPGYTSGSALASVSTHYFDSRADFSWDRAVYDYVWRDKSRGLKALGHVLHLIEDMSVPDHTRNDAHPPYADAFFQQASPYESWTSRFTPSALDGLAVTLYKSGTAPIVASELQNYFDSLAKYSNNNFFSKDTTPDKDQTYVAPSTNGRIMNLRLNSGLSANFILDKENNYKLAQMKLNLLTNNKTYFIDDDDGLVLTDYWSRLSKQSVLHGVGVVKLFFEAVKKERETKTLSARNQTIYESLASALGFGGADPKPLIADIPASAFEMHLAISQPSASLVGQVLGASTESVSPPQASTLSADDPQTGGAASPASLGAQAFAPGLPSPGFGGGGGVSANTELSAANNTTPVFGENQNAGDAVNSEATSTEPEAIPPTPPSDTEPPAVNDVEPPDIFFEIKECEKSISKDSCLLFDAGSITLLWQSSADDLDYYEFDLATTTATSTIYTLPGNGVFTFSVSAFDKSGNKNTAMVSLGSRASAGAVVINEVAWRGTSADSADEWIELYNPTDKIISLAGWVLYAEDARPYIPLAGEIKPYDYFLLERKDDNAVSDVLADSIYGNDGADWALNNSGEILTLSYASTTVDKTARCRQNVTFWCSSSVLAGYPTMERIEPAFSGEDSANWGTANSVRENGLDAGGGEISGTPRARNSLHYFVSASSIFGRDKILKSFYKEYIVASNSRLIIPAGLTLTIEPGVKVMLGGGAEIEVGGSLKAEGTASEKIIFTALSPEIPWENIRIMPESVDSKISNAVFEYGGRFFSNTPIERRAMLSIIENAAPVSDSIFQLSYSNGLRLNATDAEISGNKFSAGTSTLNNGLIATGGAPKILNNIFSENYRALQIDGESRASVERNEFRNNIEYAVNSRWSAPEMRGNFGEGNGENGIALVGDITVPGSTTTLYENVIPYVIENYPYSHMKIPAGQAVSVEKNTRFEGNGREALIEVLGTFELKGDAPADIIFTSKDDSMAGEWRGIWAKSTGLIYGGGFTLRHAGKIACPTCAGFAVDGGRVELSNGLIQNNYRMGMRFTNSSSTLQNFEFKDHQTPADTSTALVSENSSLILENLLFGNNVKNTSPEGIY